MNNRNKRRLCLGGVQGYKEKGKGRGRRSYVHAILFLFSAWSVIHASIFSIQATEEKKSIPRDPIPKSERKGQRNGPLSIIKEKEGQKNYLHI